MRLPGEKDIEQIQIRTICYGQVDVWDSREEAEQFFLKAMMMCEGSERNRYATIYGLVGLLR